MNFTETKLKGSFVVEPQKYTDERGFYAQQWSRKLLRERGLESELNQISISFNLKKGTLRGMHYQRDPYAQTKLVRCVKGAVYDVMLDLRQDSPTFGQWVVEELTSDNYRMLYIPKGFAHGFQTLTDGAEVMYQICGDYRPDAEAGVRWNDPRFGIEWPLDVTVISPRDSNYADFQNQDRPALT